MANVSLDVALDKFGRTLDFLRGRKRDYLQCFGSPAGERVLKDLLPFCRINETAFHRDEGVERMLLGRQQVALRILQHLNLPSEKLFQLYSGHPVNPNEEDTDA